MEDLKTHNFFKVLEETFVGERVEGEGGYVNLLKVKSNFFNKRVRPQLEALIEEKTKEFPAFKEELLDKLYDFFRRYLNETGTPLVGLTPYYASVFDRIYGEGDVKLYWKTSRHYYVKSDRILKSLEVEVGGFKVFFDASSVEYKKANEKKSLVYEYEDYLKDQKKLVLRVLYKEGNRETKVEEIRKKVKKKLGLSRYTEEVPSEEVIKKAIAHFEKQRKVDYFLCKEAETFLKEQFDLWMYQYVYGLVGGESSTRWSEERIKQLQALKEVAYRVIEWVSLFENELLKVWLKPRFVFNSNYVITLDRIEKKKGGIRVIEKLFRHPNLKLQIEEWKELGVVDESFSGKEVLLKNLHGTSLNPKYRFLPIDTKYFKDLEDEILSLFENLDEELDGWLIKSENFQALNTILPKFKGKVQTVYVDPPFNKEQEADYDYLVDYKDSTWITMLENRIRLGRELLRETGALFVRCDYSGNAYVKLLLNEIFGKENFKNEILVNRKRQSMGTPTKFEVESEFLYFYSKSPEKVKRYDLYVSRSLVNLKWTSFLKQEERNPRERVFLGKTLYPPKGQHFSLKQEKVDKLLKERYLRLKCRACGAVYYYDEKDRKEDFLEEVFKNKKERFKFMDVKEDTKVYGVSKLERCLNCGGDDWKVEYLTSEKQKVTDNWKDVPSYEDTFGFKTQNSEALLKRVIESTSDEGDLVLDFFLGSGTTVAVAHKLKRKWIGVEMGEHFYSVVLPRMKKVLAYDPSGISKEKDVKEKYNPRKAGGFFKYFELEQYEEILRRIKYKDVEKEVERFPERYLFTVDEKLLSSVEEKGGKLYFNPKKLYPDKRIDLAETLSLLKGLKIKRIKKDGVELEKGESVSFEEGKVELTYVAPALWWR